MAMATALKSEESRSGQSGAGVLVRLAWMLGGFVALAVTAMAIASRPAWHVGWRDAVFCAAVLASGAFRYLDVTRFQGETVNGQRATPTDLRRYLLGLAVGSSLLWICVQSIEL